MGRPSGIKEVDLLALIEKCAEVGVSHIKLGTTEISFGTAWPKKKTPVANSTTEVQSDEAQLGDRDEANLRELQNDELLISDPLAYERRQTEGGA